MLPKLETEVRRRLCDVVHSLLLDEPVLALHGPRTVGKSTLLNWVAGEAGRERIDLDDPDTRAAAESDPTLFASGPAPVCIDEYQHVPPLLDAIKAELNRDLRPGRFVLTGSTSYESLPLSAQSLTGRLHKLTVWPLSQGEIEGVHETFVEQLMDEPARLVSDATSATSREEYIARIARGGMPLALTRGTQTSRSRWLDDFVELVVTRDVMELSKVRQRALLPKLLTQLASQTAQVLVVATAAERAGIESSTAENYTRLLEAAFLIHQLPAWRNAPRSKVTARPKVHLVDSGLATRLAGLTPEKLARRQPAALSHLGHLLETFVVNEILKQNSWQEQPATTGHFRTKDGAEVDLVLESDDGAVIGIEIKSALSVPKEEFRGLRELRKLSGDAFLGGVVLYLGRRSYTYDDQLHVMPVDRLWSP